MSIDYTAHYGWRSQVEPRSADDSLFFQTAADGGEGRPPEGALLLRRDTQSRAAGLAISTAGLDQLGACWFDTDSRPCFVLGADASVVRINPAGVKLIERKVLCVHDGVLSFGRAQADSVLMGALEAVAREKVCFRRLVVLGDDKVWRSLTMHRGPSEASLVFLSIRTQALTERPAMEPLIEAFHLTPAQAKVVVCLAEGLVPKEIGRRMNISTHTVRTHLRAIYGKLNVRGIAGALRLTSQLLE